MIPVLWILVAALIGYIGRYRVMGFWGYFLLSLFLGPVVGALVCAISQDVRPIGRDMRPASQGMSPRA